MGREILALVMAGGMGERLMPLTEMRAKPAVPFGGIFRIIDFTLSNCINSDVRRVIVLTQYKSHSLSNHLKQGWNFLSRRLDQYVDEIPAQMQTGRSWYKGTADAIRQNMAHIEQLSPRLVLVLSGDHIYKMDYRLMRRYHDEKRTGLTVAVIRVPAEEAAGAFGVLEVDSEFRIVGFEEKPKNPKCIPGTNDCLASMGIYLFDTDYLHTRLDNDFDDFGKHVIPDALAKGETIYAWDYTTLNQIQEVEYVTAVGHRMRETVARASDSAYWRDVGTLDSLWRANLELVSARPPFNLYGELWPIFTSPHHFPPAKFVHEGAGRTGTAVNSIVSEGVIVSGATVRNSVISPGVYIHSYSVVENSVLLGGEIRGGNITSTNIGRGCRIRNAIIDKNVKLPEGTTLGHDRAQDEMRGFKTVNIAGSDDYLVVVPKEYSL